MTKVAVVQEYVPNYRASFFSGLRTELEALGLDLNVAAGKPNKLQKKRNDWARDSNNLMVHQFEIGVFGRRFVLRWFPFRVSSFRLVIFEHARRNLDVYFYLAFKNVFFRKTKIAFWGHGVDFVQDRPTIETWLLGFLARRADHYFVYTERGMAELKKIGLPSNQITVVFNSIELIAPEHASEKPTTNKSRCVLFVGGLDEAKGAHHLPRIATYLAEHHTDVTIHVIGDGELRKKIELQTSHLENIKLHGALFGSDKAELISEAQLLVQPGRVGLIALESLFYGSPIVTMAKQKHGPEFDYLSTETSVVSGDSIEDYCVALADILEDKERLEMMQMKCRANSEKFTLNRMVTSFAQGVAGCI